MHDTNSFDCTDLKALLSALVDDELDDGRRHDAERHIAECAKCRALVDDAERLDGLVEQAVDAFVTPLPEGFAGAILARTVHEAPATSRNWTSWVGWVAAVAALALAVTAWVTQQRTGAPQDRTAGGPNGAALRVVAANYQPTGRSWILDEPSPEAPPPAWPVASDAARATTDAPSRAEHAPTQLASTDRDTMHAAGLLVAALADADVESFGDFEQVRRIALYDEVLPRLRAARANVDPLDRTAVLAAESLLLRVVHGPIDQADLQELRNIAAGSELARALFRIGGAEGWSV